MFETVVAILFMAGLAVLVVVSWVLSLQRENQIEAAWQAVAQALQLTYNQLLQQVEGVYRGRQLTLNEQMGRGRNAPMNTVLVLRVANPHQRVWRVGPVSALRQIADGLTHLDVPMAYAEAFDEQFAVAGEPAAWATAFGQRPAVRQCLRQMGPSGELVVSANVLRWTLNYALLEPKEMARFINVACDLAEAWDAQN